MREGSDTAISFKKTGGSALTFWTVARGDGALTDAPQSNSVDVFGPNGASAPPTLYRGKMGTISRRVEEFANYLSICGLYAAKKVALGVQTFHNEITGTF
jgi:hypothetical protein